MGLYLITMLAFSVGLVSIFGVFCEKLTRFYTFESAFKKLFWIIFDPGKEEYTDIGLEETECDVKPTNKAPRWWSDHFVDRLNSITDFGK